MELKDSGIKCGNGVEVMKNRKSGKEFEVDGDWIETMLVAFREMDSLAMQGSHRMVRDLEGTVSPP